MSAIPASAAVGAKPAAGQEVPFVVPSAPRPGARKRGAATPRSVADAASSDSPVPPSKVFQRGRNVATSSANGDASADRALLSHPKDVSNAMLMGEDERARQPTKDHKTVAHPIHRGSPLKYKHVRTREAYIAGRRRPNSILDLTGHFFSRFFLVCLIGAGLGSSVWNWRMRPQFSSSSLVTSSETERLEEFVAKTTKWMRVQLEAVDMKIGHEIGALKKDLHKELYSQQTHIATEVKSLKEKISKVGASVDALFTQGGPLTKKEALEFVKVVVDKRAAEGKGRVLSLDDVRTAARQIVLRELDRHSADGIRRVDYALGSGGGRVIAHSEGYYVSSGADWRNVFGFLPGSNRIHPFAEKILQPSFGEPGQCLPLKGRDVWVDIALRTTIRPDAISLEHVAKDNAYDVSNAPKDFRLFGWQEARGHRDVQNPVTLRSFGDFTYDIEKASVQSFSLADENVAGALINMIRLHVLSNHGSATHTCIYRVRVHGSDPALALALAE